MGAHDGSAAKWARRAGIALASLALALVLAELALRAFWPVQHLAPIDAADLPGVGVLVHRPSSVPGLPYELVPNARGTYMGTPVQISSLGTRGPEVAREKPAGTFRIAAIGDSLTFGYGVAAEEAWPAALERALNEDPGSLGARRVEVVNFGVSGYCTADEALVLEHKALAIDPDLVVVGYFLNDPQIEPLQALQRAFRTPEWWERSHLLRLVDAWRFQRGRARFGGDGYRFQHDPHGERWQRVLSSFDAMHTAADARHVPVILATLPAFAPFPSWDAYRWSDVHAQVLDAAREHGLVPFDLVPAFRAAGRAPKSTSVDSEHPNGAGHEIIARALAAEIRRVVAERR